MAVSQLRPANPAIRREPNQLVIPIGTLFDDWLRAAQDAIRDRNSSHWWVTDALIFGEAHYGEIYAQVIDDHEISVDTARRMIATGRAFSVQRRRKCGWTFHYAVKGLAEREQDELLDLVDKNKWNRETLREVLRERKLALEGADTARQGSLAPETPPSATVYLLAPPAAEPAPESGEAHYESDNLRVPAAEPEGSNQPPPTPTEAVALLEQYAASPQVPPHVRAAFHVLIDERDLLLRIATSAKLSIDMAQGFTSPRMREAVEVWRERYPSTPS